VFDLVSLILQHRLDFFDLLHPDYAVAIDIRCNRLEFHLSVQFSLLIHKGYVENAILLHVCNGMSVDWDDASHVGAVLPIGDLTALVKLKCSLLLLVLENASTKFHEVSY
jgi:hypothetical protein